jgi:predicted RNA binding protein YcfA (HicA-like mRNA interferase family)
MGRLSGFKYNDVARKLRKLGFEFVRQGAGSHEIWRHPETNRKITIAFHAREMPEGTLRKILRQAGIDVEEFLRV